MSRRITTSREGAVGVSPFTSPRRQEGARRDEHPRSEEWRKTFSDTLEIMLIGPVEYKEDIVQATFAAVLDGARQYDNTALEELTMWLRIHEAELRRQAQPLVEAAHHNGFGQICEAVVRTSAPPITLDDIAVLSAEVQKRVLADHINLVTTKGLIKRFGKEQLRKLHNEDYNWELLTGVFPDDIPRLQAVLSTGDSAVFSNTVEVVSKQMEQMGPQAAEPWARLVLGEIQRRVVMCEQDEEYKTLIRPLDQLRLMNGMSRDWAQYLDKRAGQIVAAWVGSRKMRASKVE